jgi:hypothetical protein
VILDAHVAWAGIVGNRDEKAAFLPENPGYPAVAGSGSVLNAGMTARVRF